MKLRAALNYQLYGGLKVVAIYYGVMLAFNVFFAAIGSGSSGMNGAELSSLIVLFVLGLNSVKEPFRLLTASGRTRRTAFSAIVLSLAAAAVLMAAADMLLKLALAPLFRTYESLYDMAYGAPETFSQVAVKYFWSVALYCCAAMTGTFIAALYYRMNKALKISVSVGVPALLFVALPIVELNYTHGEIMKTVAKILLYMLGFGGASPAPAMFCLWGTLLALVAAGVFWACLRRAEVKK